jgi:glucokinase
MIDDPLQSNNRESHYIMGMDLGATKLNAFLLDHQSKKLAQTKKQLEEKEAHYLETLIIETYNELLTRVQVPPTKIWGLGLAVPGYIDVERGIVFRASNLNLHNWRLVPKLSKSLGVSVFIEKDVNAAAYGEYLYGFEERVDNLVFISVGTGIGMGIILMGSIYKGELGLAGELGHVVLEPNGPLCTCGKRGCLEYYSSGWGIAKRYIEQTGDKQKHRLSLTAYEIARRANEGDILAQKILTEGAEKLSLAIGNVINIFSVQSVILGGGIIENNHEYFQKVRTSTPKYIQSDIRNNVRLRKSILGYDAGALGATAIVLKGKRHIK